MGTSISVNRKNIYVLKCKRPLLQPLYTKNSGLACMLSSKSLRLFVVRHCLLCSHAGLHSIARELFQLHRGKFHRHPAMFKSFRTWLEQLHASARRRTLRLTSPTHAAETRSHLQISKAPEGQHTAQRECTQVRELKPGKPLPRAVQTHYESFLSSLRYIETT